VWPLLGSGAASLGVFGLGYALGYRHWRRHHDVPDRVYRIIVVDETVRSASHHGQQDTYVDQGEQDSH
jgi:hypothetical protein